MTLLVASLFADTVSELTAKAARAWSAGADAVEIRTDNWEDAPEALNRFLKAQAERTWIVTCRSREEGGRFEGESDRRVSFLIAAAHGSRAIVDFELADFLRSANIAQKIRLAADGHASDSPRLILSSHTFGATLPDVDAQRASCHLADPAAIFKCAYEASNAADAFPALDLMHEFGPSVVGIAMGEFGIWTRVLARKLGAFASYFSLDDASSTAPGQLTVSEAITPYRWRRIGESTRVFGVLGDPVAQSLSPRLFNHWFDVHDVDAVYVPLRLQDRDGELFRFLDGCFRRPWLDIGGFSVTKPHKTSVLRWLGDRVDRTTRLVGAINTIVVHEGAPIGFNTDGYAALDSLVAALGIARTDLGEYSVDVLGTGGAARAVMAALYEIGCRMTIYGRSASTTAELGEYFRAEPKGWESRRSRSGDIVINCTSVGMAPAVDESPLPADAFGSCRLAFDLIYNPSETRFLADAKAHGVRTLNGLDMFLRQAVNQFELWTGIRPDIESARALVVDELARRSAVLGSGDHASARGRSL